MVLIKNIAIVDNLWYGLNMFTILCVISGIVIYHMYFR